MVRSAKFVKAHIRINGLRADTVIGKDYTAYIFHLFKATSKRFAILFIIHTSAL
jgi:hypothetical protein